MMNDTTLEGITQALIQRSKQIPPDTKSELQANLLQDFKQNYIAHFDYFMLELINQLGKIEDSQALNREELLERINIFHFILFEVLSTIASSMHTLTLDGLTRNALRTNVEQFLSSANSQEQIPYQQLLEKINQTANYDMATLLNIPPEMETVHAFDNDACTDLLKISARTSPTTIMAESALFLARYGAEFENPDYCDGFINQLLLHVGFLESIDNKPLIKLETHALIVNALFFTLSKLCHKEQLREQRIRVLLQLNKHACMALALSLKIIRDSKLHLGEHISVVSKIKGSYTLLQDVFQETNALFTLLLKNQAQTIYSKQLVDELKKQSVDFFVNNVNHALMMAEFADQFESRAQARIYIQEALNYSIQMKSHESGLRSLKSKSKKDMDRLFKELARQTAKDYKHFQADNRNGDLCSAFYNVIVGNEASNLSALTILSENVQKDAEAQTELTSVAYANIRNKIAKFQSRFNALSPPTSTAIVMDWKEAINSAFQLIQLLKRCNHREEIAQLLPQYIQLFDVIISKLGAKSNQVIFKITAEHLDIIKSRIIEINQQCKNLLQLRVQPTAVTAIPPTPLIVIGERPLKQALETLLSDDFNPNALGHSLSFLLADQNMAQQIIEAILKQLNQTLITDKDLLNSDLTQILNFLIKTHRTNMLLLYIIHHVLDKHHALTYLRNETIGLLFTIASPYFSAGLTYFSATEDYTEKDADIFKKLYEHYQTLEKLKSDYTDYIFHLKSSDQKNKIWAAHLVGIQYQINYIQICLMLNNFERASEAITTTNDDLYTINEAIEDIAAITGTSSAKLGHELITSYGTPLEKASKQIAIFEKLNKPNMVVYQSDHIFYCDSPQDQVKKLLEALKSIPPEMGNENYAAIIAQYHRLWTVYTFRFKMLAYFQTLCDQIISTADQSENKPPADKLEIVRQQQVIINGLFFLIKELTPYHDQRFPTEQMTHHFQKGIMVVMAQQAQIFWLLIAENHIPLGYHALYYQQLKNNYDVFIKHILSEFSADLESKVASEPDYVAIQAKALCDFSIYIAAVAEQFANFDWTHEAYNVADSSLALLARTAKLSEAHAQCKSALEHRKVTIPPQLRNLHETFLQLSEKVEQVDSFLEGFCKSKGFHLNHSNSEIKTLADELMQRVATYSQNPIELCNVCLTLNQQIELPRIITIVSTIKTHLLDNQLEVEELHGITNLLSETTSLFVQHLDRSLLLLNKEVKRLEIIEAKRIKDEMQRIQQKLQRENRKNSQRSRIIENEPILEIKKAEKKPTVPVNRERQRKRETFVYSEEAGLSYDMILAQEQTPKKLSKKELRAKKKAMKHQAMLATTEQVTQTCIEPIAIQTKAPEAIKSVVSELTASQLKKQRRKQRNHVAEEVSVDLIDALINEIAALTLEQEKDFAHNEDNTWLVADIIVERDLQLQKLLDVFRNRNIKAYCYGGYPRDKLLNRPHKDIDLVVFCAPEIITMIFSDAAKQHDTIPNQFSLHGNIDIRCTEGSLLDFANGLDITENALFVGANGQLFDPKGGYSHLLHSNHLETIGDSEQSFAEDPIKMYRLIRQSFDLQKSIQSKDRIAIYHHANKLASLNFSDFRKHFSSLFLTGNAAFIFTWIFKRKLLGSLIPMLKTATYSYIYVPFWLHTHCKRIDADLNRINNYPFYTLIAILLAPHCHNLTKLTPHLKDEIELTIVNDFFKPFTNYQPNEKELTFFKEQLSLFSAAFKQDSKKQRERLEHKQISKQTTAIVHQYRLKAPSESRSKDHSANHLPNQNRMQSKHPRRSFS